jgi:hypothetical protein
MNLEGLTLGPRLASGHPALVGIVDDGGATSNGLQRSHPFDLRRSLASSTTGARAIP